MLPVRGNRFCKAYRYILDEQLIADSLKHIKDVKLEYYYKNHNLIHQTNYQLS